MRDFFGVELEIGDSIVSGTHYGSYNKSIKMRKGVIVKFNEVMITCMEEDGEKFNAISEKCVKVSEL